MNLIGERLHAHVPLRFEGVRARAPFAAAEVELTNALLRSQPHKLGVHEIVGGHCVSLRRGSRVIRKDGLPKPEGEDARYRLVSRVH